MIEDYLAVADRIRQELTNLERVVNRVERAITAARQRPEDQDLYIDSAALNLHDFYAGLERIFQQTATTIDGKLPAGQGWHRELLHQMQADIPDLRPPVLSAEAGQALDEFLRFRHVGGLSLPATGPDCYQIAIWRRLCGNLSLVLSINWN